MKTPPALFLTLLPLASSGHENPVHPALAGLNGRWDRALPELEVGALAVAVVEGGELVHRYTWGRRDPEGTAGVTPETMFYIASATKPFVALAVMQLVEQGRLELDAPVKTTLPRFRLADPDATERITVRDLLCHAPGLSSFPIVLLDAYTGEITEDRYYRFLAEVTPLDRPSYSNLHFTLAGRLIEAVTGQPWRDYLAEHVFAPAGMTHTTGYADWMYAQEDVAWPAVPGPAGELVRALQRKTDATMHAAGGLGTSIDDFARWALVQLGHGQGGDARLLDGDLTQEMFALSSRVQDGGLVGRVEGFGLGWQRGSYRDQLLLGHGGGYVGSGSWIGFLPELDLGLVILVTGEVGARVALQLVATDVLERFLSGDEILDRLDDARETVARARARRARQPVVAVEPFVGARPPGEYAGPWHSLDLGTLRFDVAAGTAHLGGMAMDLRGGEPETFWLYADGTELAGRFVVEGQRVTAVELEALEGLEPRFTRQ
jgi:CubicO group peptidase (beta-lactamase class C family)